jgi:hypothetical protein
MDNGNERRSQQARLSITSIECTPTRPGFLLGRASARQDTTTGSATWGSCETTKLVGCCRKLQGFTLKETPAPKKPLEACPSDTV